MTDEQIEAAVNAYFVESYDGWEETMSGVREVIAKVVAAALGGPDKE